MKRGCALSFWENFYCHIQFPELPAPLIPGLGAESFLEGRKNLRLFGSRCPLMFHKILPFLVDEYARLILISEFQGILKWP